MTTLSSPPQTLNLMENKLRNQPRVAHHRNLLISSDLLYLHLIGELRIGPTDLPGAQHLGQMRVTAKLVGAGKPLGKPMLYENFLWCLPKSESLTRSERVALPLAAE